MVVGDVVTVLDRIDVVSERVHSRGALRVDLKEVSISSSLSGTD